MRRLPDRGRDAGLCGLLFVATLAYLAYWPRDFYVFDEGLFLYEAKRVLDGQLMYRDFFEIVTPGSLYLMAGVYALFGVSLEAARAAMAVVHGLIGVLTYLVCRRLGARPTLAVLIALLHLTLGFPAMTIATPHWLSTAINLVLLLVVVRRPCTTAGRAMAWGALCGLLILVQQQRGVVMASGAALMVAWDGYERAGWRPFLRRAAGFALGLLAVVVPVMVGFVIAAGLDNVGRALVLHPIRRYPRTELGRGGWGVYFPHVHPLGFVISNLPLILPVGVAAAVWQWRGRLAWPQRRPLAVTVVFALTGLLSVSYNPNYVHFVLVAPLWLVLAALLLEMGLQRLPVGTGPLRMVTTVALAGLVLGACWQLVETIRTRRAWLPIRSPTAFGYVDFANRDQAAYVAWLTELFRREQVGELFAYAAIPGLYLLTGTENPTRFQIMMPDYTERDQLEEIVSTLERRRVPYVLRGLYPGTKSLEPLHSYMHRRYEPVAGPPAADGRPVTLYQRRPDATGYRLADPMQRDS